MKTREDLFATLMGIIVAATGCQTSPVSESQECPQCPEPANTAPAAAQVGRSRDELAAALGMHNNFQQKVMCTPPSHPKGHLVRGDRFAFGYYQDGWYLLPHQDLIDQGWKEVIPLEHRPGPPRTGFPPACKTEAAFTELMGRPPEDDENEMLRALPEAGLDSFENWQGEIGYIEHAAAGVRMCHKIRLQFFNYTVADTPLSHNNYFVEIERCNHAFDVAAGVPQVQLWHGGIYHGTD